jgi:hypothetical protein
MKRRWRIVLMCKTGQVLGAAEVIQFELDEFQRRRLLVEEPSSPCAASVRTVSR